MRHRIVHTLLGSLLLASPVLLLQAQQPGPPNPGQSGSGQPGRGRPSRPGNSGGRPGGAARPTNPGDNNRPPPSRGPGQNGRPNPGNNRPQPPRPNPGQRPPPRPNPGPGRPPARPGNRPPQWGRPPQSRPSYQFRPNDRSYLRRYYGNHLRYINRARRPRFIVGGYFPFGDIGYLTPVPPNVYGYLPPPPPGYQVGYFDGYVVVYDLLTYFMANVVDLLQ